MAKNKRRRHQTREEREAWKQARNEARLEARRVLREGRRRETLGRARLAKNTRMLHRVLQSELLGRPRHRAVLARRLARFCQICYRKKELVGGECMECHRERCDALFTFEENRMVCESCGLVRLCQCDLDMNGMHDCHSCHRWWCPDCHCDNLKDVCMRGGCWNTQYEEICRDCLDSDGTDEDEDEWYA